MLCIQSEALCDVNEVLPAAALDSEAKYVNAHVTQKLKHLQLCNILCLFDSIHLF